MDTSICVYFASHLSVGYILHVNIWKAFSEGSIPINIFLRQLLIQLTFIIVIYSHLSLLKLLVCPCSSQLVCIAPLCIKKYFINSENFIYYILNKKSPISFPSACVFCCLLPAVEFVVNIFLCVPMLILSPLPSGLLNTFSLFLIESSFRWTLVWIWTFRYEFCVCPPPGGAVGRRCEHFSRWGASHWQTLVFKTVPLMLVLALVFSTTFGLGSACTCISITLNRVRFQGGEGLETGWHRPNKPLFP